MQNQGRKIWPYSNVTSHQKRKKESTNIKEFKNSHPERKKKALKSRRSKKSLSGLVHLPLRIVNLKKRTQKRLKKHTNKQASQINTLPGLVPLSSPFQECKLDGKAVKVVLVQVAIVVKIVP